MKDIKFQVIKYCTDRGFEVKKIFYDNKNCFVYAPPRNSDEGDENDGTYLFVKGKLKPFTPSENFELYDDITQDKNLIYEED